MAKISAVYLRKCEATLFRKWVKNNRDYNQYAILIIYH